MTKAFTLLILALAVVIAQEGDTLTIHPITFATPSPEGWNAQYKTIAPFPDTPKKWAKILMV
jgi:hypothetical protein